MNLNVLAFALAFGVWWGGGVFVATWWLLTQGGDTTAPTLLDHFYYGYSLTPLAALSDSAGGSYAERSAVRFSLGSTTSSPRNLRLRRMLKHA